MNVACDDSMLLQPKEETFIKNEKYYSFNNLRRKSLKNSEEESKNINRIKSLSTSSYSLKTETLKSLSLDKVNEEESGSLSSESKIKHDKSNEQISIFQMERDDNSKDNNNSANKLTVNTEKPIQIQTNINPLSLDTIKKLNKEQPMTAIEPVMPNLNAKLCMTPETVLRTKYDILTSYERVEIRDYEEIWYIGSSSVQKIDIAYKKPTERKHGEKPEVVNNGYDDSRGDYHIVLHDHINYRYEIISMLGKGSFGKVLKCYDHKEKNYVAVKIIKNKKRFEKQGMVEVKVLDAIKSRDPDDVMNSYNIKFIESFYFRGHLCIVNELLGINLYEWIKNGGFRGVTISMIRHITKEVLISLEVLEQKKIVHCDLKPENILLRDPMQIKPSLSSTDLDRIGIKVIDFGSSCYEHERIYTYVQSRFYRSPEVILGIPYNMSIDMWSLGCILAELYTGYPIFPGENEEEQLACIMEIMGTPEPYIIEQGSRKKNFFEANGSPKIFANSKGKKRRPGSLSLATVLRCRDNTFLDFITQCLQWDPEKRMTPSQGLKHEFITKANKKIASDNSSTVTTSTTNNNNNNSKSISTNSMFSTFEEFKNLNNSLKKSKVPTPNSGLVKSKLSSTTKVDKAVSPLVQVDKETKSFTGIKHSSTQIANPMNNITRSSLVKTNTIGGYNSGRKSSGSNIPKVSSAIDDENNISLRKSSNSIVNYGDSNGSSKVAKIIAAAEQKTFSSNKTYPKKDSSLAIETIKNVRRPSVKEMAFAKENMERANALVNLKKSQSKEGNNSTKLTNSLLDYKFPKTKPKNSLSINVTQLGNNNSNTQSKSAYPKLSSGFFKENVSELTDIDGKSRPRKYSLLSKSLNPSLEALNSNSNEVKDENKGETEQLEFNKIDITNNNKSHVSSLKQPAVYSNSANNILDSIQTIRKTYNGGNVTNSTSTTTNSNANTTNIGTTNNSKYSSSIPTINDDNYDTPVTQQSTTINSLSLLTQDIPSKSRPRAFSHSAYSSSQGSSIPRLASIYKNSSNNITKTINKINSNIESHNNSITKERDREINNTIKTAGLVTKRKSAFSLKSKANQAAQSTQSTQSTTSSQPRWRI